MANKDALIKLQAEYFQLQSQEGSEKRLNQLQNQIQNGVMKMLGITAPNEEYGKLLGEIKDKGLALSREKPKSMLEKGIEKVTGFIRGKQYGGDIKRYGQPRKVNTKYDG
tara:strand:- start:1542 stop:1871 length:330 start_codon:yes stop_codon:yes gene_type:complete